MFLQNPETEYYLRETARIAKGSPASTYRILNKLVKLEFLNCRQIKTVKLYVLASGKGVEMLKSMLEVNVVKIFVEQASGLFGVDEILLLDDKDKTKANVLIISSGVDTDELKRIVADIKDKHAFTINHMSLGKDQYEQMAAMGLYPGSKKILYQRPR